MQYQWACGASNQYRCLQPAFCSVVSPDDAVSIWNGPIVGDDWGNTDEAGSTEIWANGDAANTGSFTYRGASLSYDPITTDKLNAAERDVADCKSWTEGANFIYHDLVCETGSIFECLDTTGEDCA